jgi:hypothetical protein
VRSKGRRISREHEHGGRKGDRELLDPEDIVGGEGVLAEALRFSEDDVSNGGKPNWPLA